MPPWRHISTTELVSCHTSTVEGYTHTVDGHILGMIRLRLIRSFSKGLEATPSEFVREFDKF